MIHLNVGFVVLVALVGQRVADLRAAADEKSDLLECTTRDVARVQLHLFETESELRAHPPEGLTPAQFGARLRNLEHLHAYAVRGVVPINDLLSVPTPFFIDGSGTRCAMAALIEAEGGHDLVMRIARERNNARISELGDEPELVAWLASNGMTADEAGRVQPTYYECRVRRPWGVCSPGHSEATQILATRVEDGGLFGRGPQGRRADL